MNSSIIPPVMPRLKIVIVCCLALAGCGLGPGLKSQDLEGAWNGHWNFDLNPLHYDGKAATLFTFNEETKEVTFFLKATGDYFDTMDEPAELLLTGPYTDTTFNLAGDSSWLGHIELNYNDGTLSGHASPTFSKDTTIRGHASGDEFRLMISFFGFDQTNFALAHEGPAPAMTIDPESALADDAASDTPSP